MNEEWPDYIYEAEVVTATSPATSPDVRRGELNLTAALEHLSLRREQVYSLRRRAAVLAAVALVEGGIILGLLLGHLGG
jgi:hypothetical protein